ncbi:MAG: acyl CoA:acetate/3-ketoacid CoA transferase [Deltaproteobacteria bacterium]|jgi:propionate CoA-transferase|nr:acyl CoA:acetate/3-ketoacid CoA transferase [Deltaproteobacteria bacterium]
MKEGSAKKVISAREAVSLVKDGDVLALHGAGGGNVEPDLLIKTLGERFIETKEPRNLTIFHVSGLGDRKTTGLGYLAHERLVKRVIGGHYGMAPKMAKLVLDEKIEGYNLPQGVMSQWLREVAGGRPGLVTQVGLGTFVDPRLQGGKLNRRCTEDLVDLIELREREWLFYRTFPINVAFIRGSTADEKGNISLELEPAWLDVLPMAMAAHNSGGLVIAQVKRLVKGGMIPSKSVKVPGSLVDKIVVYPEQWQTVAGEYNPAFSGEVKVPLETLDKMELNERKVIGRRGAMELAPGFVINMGVGMPDGVASVAAEEGIEDRMTAFIEQGLIGGIPAPGVLFGVMSNSEAVIDQPYQFDFFDGGGLDRAFLGFAEADGHGNVNASKFGQNLAGTGGFVNISQGAKRIIFCGTFTAGGLKTRVGGGKIEILQEGAHKKFVKEVEQITFSGDYAARKRQEVVFITERAVIERVREGMVIAEIAPGVDLESHVLSQMAFKPIISPTLREMDARIFREGRMGL